MALSPPQPRRVDPVVYWVSRAVLQPFFLVFFAMRLEGRANVPPSGGVVLASNHRSFLDPFVIGMTTRRPLYFMAKKELFAHPVVAWFLSHLGAFPIVRGAADQDAMAMARALLVRGEAVLIFPEGTRVRPGPLGAPRRGVGRLVLETGVPVVPVAIIGTEDVRAGWRIRPRRVRVSVGAPLSFPRAEPVSPQLAAAVTERIWAAVAARWTALGGTVSDAGEPRPEGIVQAA